MPDPAPLEATSPAPLQKQVAASNAKLQVFYEKLAEHERLLSDSSDEHAAHRSNSKQHQEAHQAIVVAFNPEEQDEENYQFHNANQEYFECSQVEDMILEDLRQEWLDNVSDCSFMPRMVDYDGSKRGGPNAAHRGTAVGTASQMSVN